MRRAVGTVAVGAVLAGVAVGLMPLALRHVGFFHVRQVELTGLRYLPAESVLVRLEIPPRRNLFESNKPLERRARELPGVADVRVERRLPGTLRLIFTQHEAVAMAPGPDGMVPLDATGHPLPYEPAATGLDLPVVPRPDTVLVRALWRVRATDSALFREVQSARRYGKSDVLLDLGGDELIVGREPSGEQIRAVGAVREHLAETGRAARRLDARFAGRVFARTGGV